MDLRSVIVLFFCSLLAVVMGQEDSDTPIYTARLPPPYSLGWRSYMMPMYGGEKRSMTEKMRSLKGRYNSGQIRNILFGK